MSILVRSIVCGEILGEDGHDKIAAYTTLWHTLVTLSKVIAPFTPFMSESIYANLVRNFYPDAPESVHLTDFPVSTKGMWKRIWSRS